MLWRVEYLSTVDKSWIDDIKTEEHFLKRFAANSFFANEKPVKIIHEKPFPEPYAMVYIDTKTHEPEKLTYYDFGGNLDTIELNRVEPYISGSGNRKSRRNLKSKKSRKTNRKSIRRR
jgi:hypothetical protein